MKASSAALVGTSVAGLASAGKGEEKVEGELPYPDRGALRVDDSLRSLTPYYYLLTLDRDRQLKLLDEATVDEQERRKARAFLKTVWRRFPVERVQDGDDVVITLTEDPSQTAMTKDEHKQFSAAAHAVADGFSNEDGGMTIQWNGNNHKTMARNTLEHFDLAGYEVDDIAGHADDPDVTPCQNCSFDLFPGSWSMPDWIKNKIEKGINEFAHHYGHYYDPNEYSYTIAGFGIEFNGIGAAPWYCETEMNEAKNNSYSTKREALGRALHYVHDVSVPLHSGMGIEQANLNIDCGWSGCGAGIDPRTDLHYGYENYVSRNLTSGEKFIDDYDSMLSWNYDPVDCVQTVADEGNSYSYEVFHLMMDNGKNPDNWSSSSDLNDLNTATANCLAKAGGYAHALVEQVY